MLHLTHRRYRIPAPLRRYGAAVLLTTLALLLRLHLTPLLGDNTLLSIFTIPVVLSAWYGGIRAGLFTIVLSMFAGAYFVLPPPYAFLTDRSNLTAMGLFGLQGLLLSVLSALVHARTQALHSANDRLQVELTERQRAEHALRESEERFRQLAEHIHEVFWLFDAAQQSFIYVSPAYTEIWGRSTDSLYAAPRSWLEAIHPDDRQRALAAHEQSSLGISDEEYRIVRPTGEVRWIRNRAFPIRNSTGEVYRIAGIAEDITAQKGIQAQLEHQALYDALTGLPNRSLFMDRLAHVLAAAKRHPMKRFAVLFLDLDRFKTINDSLGHLMGDQLLIGVARRLEAILRPEDTIARLGGDEFVILLEDLPHISDATRVADRIHQALTTPVRLSSADVLVSASIGITVSTTGYDRSEEVLRDADTAMYRAKALGKARYAIFDRAMHTHALRRLTLEAELRRAIECEELQLHYQPIVSLANGTINGVEALVRWQHPKHGLLPPTQFIPVAEETGLIVPLGEWVMRTACAQAKAWHEAGWPLTMAINLSARQFQHSDLRTLIADSLAEVGLAPHFLRLELTESTVLTNLDADIMLLWDLHAHGVQLVLDDFGTGYSSLSYLKGLPITSLKIDRTFVHDIPRDPNDSAIVSAITALAHHLDLSVTAEGVETDAQLDFLRTKQVDEGQGYLFNRPMGAELLTHRLQQGWYESVPAPAGRGSHDN